MEIATMMGIEIMIVDLTITAVNTIADRTIAAKPDHQDIIVISISLGFGTFEAGVVIMNPKITF